MNKGDRYIRVRMVIFALILTLTFSVGIFLVGWLALKLHWLKSPDRLPWRLIATLAGTGLPLFLFPLLVQPLAPGSPAFGL